MRNKVEWLDLSAFPKRYYVAATYFAGDIRELAKKCNAPAPVLLRDDLDEYYALYMCIDGVPIEISSHVPCVEQEFTVYADRAEAQIAREIIMSLLSDVGYELEEVGTRWGQDDDE